MPQCSIFFYIVIATNQKNSKKFFREIEMKDRENQDIKREIEELRRKLREAGLEG
jgi:hypothetical protein